MHMTDYAQITHFDSFYIFRFPGVLALQGAFIEHENMLRTLGADCVEHRQKKDLETKLDGLVLPGGESTVQGKLLRELEMFEELRHRIATGLPVLAKVNQKIVGVRFENQIALSFHPELGQDTRIHQYFLSRISS